MDDIAAINARLDVAATLMFAKDMAIVDELWSEGFRLVGSEKSEVADTRAGVETRIARIFSLPMQLRWVWTDKSFNIENDIAWVFATGHLEFVPDLPGGGPLPYRLVAIFRRAEGGWQWRLYSGSEPVPDRT